jgi:hypothetical protein
VRHGGGTHFAFFQPLLEIAQRDIAPDITIEVDQDGIEALYGIEELGDVVVRFDLRGVRVEGRPSDSTNALALASQSTSG